ncbi:uncharacterized protein LOC123292412 [Chrysoperla carnea]|uniref:uncharacterized protein LOC123292412 n=1 Tax=Chrysoperla carnea TaxID=189513 RepID=UPI001D091052|nr:uncharacterized protein LOC123292412 [Chrysoperla carnea]
MHQFLTILIIFNVMLISTLQAQPQHSFTSLREKLLYKDMCDAVDESDMKMMNGQCIFGQNLKFSILCGKNICYQGPDDVCNTVIKCNSKLQCVDRKCTGCITLDLGFGMVETCSIPRKNNF